MDQEFTDRLIRRYREQALEHVALLNEALRGVVAAFAAARQAGRPMRPREFNEVAERTVAEIRSSAGVLHASFRPLTALHAGRIALRHLVPADTSSASGNPGEPLVVLTNAIRCAVMTARKTEMRARVWLAPVLVDHRALERMAALSGLTAASFRTALDDALLTMTPLAKSWPAPKPDDLCLPGPADGCFVVRAVRRFNTDPGQVMIVTMTGAEMTPLDTDFTQSVVEIVTYVPVAEMTDEQERQLAVVRTWLERHRHLLMDEPEVAAGCPKAEPGKNFQAAAESLRGVMAQSQVSASAVPAAVRDAPRPHAPPNIPGLPLWSGLVARRSRFPGDAANLARALTMASTYRLSAPAALFLQTKAEGPLGRLLSDVRLALASLEFDAIWVETTYADRGIANRPTDGASVDLIGFLIERLEADYFRICSSYATPEGDIDTTFVDLHMDWSQDRTRLRERTLIHHDPEDIRDTPLIASVPPAEREAAIALECAFGFQISMAHQEALATIHAHDGPKMAVEFAYEATRDWHPEVRFVVALLARFRHPSMDRRKMAPMACCMLGRPAGGHRRGERFGRVKGTLALGHAATKAGVIGKFPRSLALPRDDVAALAQSGKYGLAQRGSAGRPRCPFRPGSGGALRARGHRSPNRRTSSARAALFVRPTGVVSGDERRSPTFRPAFTSALILAPHQRQRKRACSVRLREST